MDIDAIDGLRRGVQQEPHAFIGPAGGLLRSCAIGNFLSQTGIGAGEFRGAKDDLLLELQIPFRELFFRLFSTSDFSGESKGGGDSDAECKDCRKKE